METEGRTDGNFGVGRVWMNGNFGGRVWMKVFG